MFALSGKKVYYREKKKFTIERKIVCSLSVKKKITIERKKVSYREKSSNCKTKSNKKNEGN